MLWIKKASFDEHMRNDAAQFASIIAALRAHDTNVDEKHRENKKDAEQIKADVGSIKTALDEIVKLRPAIDAGIAADVASAARKRLVRWVWGAILATGMAVGTMFPLIQWLMTLHFHIGAS